MNGVDQIVDDIQAVFFRNTGKMGVTGSCFRTGVTENALDNLSALWRFYSWAEACAFKWLNRRGGKRKSFTLKVFTKAIDLLGIAKPKMRVVNWQHRVFT
nr:hypothetical protein [uncultured Desulfobacter sp.]